MDVAVQFGVGVIDGVAESVGESVAVKVWLGVMVTEGVTNVGVGSAVGDKNGEGVTAGLFDLLGADEKIDFIILIVPGPISIKRSMFQADRGGSFGINDVTGGQTPRPFTQVSIKSVPNAISPSATSLVRDFMSRAAFSPKWS